jgi:hypothetical protein
MVNFNQEYFENGCYFYLKNGKDKISLYYSVSENISESRKKDEKKDFTKKSEIGLKKYIKKTISNKTKKSKKEIEKDLKNLENKGEIEELVDFDGTSNNSKIPIYNRYLSPKKTTDQTIPMARVSNDPVTRGYRVYWGESKENEDDIINEVNYSDAFGYDETENKDFKGTVKTLKKMGVDNPVQRAKQFGKLPKEKVKKDKTGKKVLKQRLSEKDSIDEERKEKMKKMVEDILTKKYGGDGDVIKKEDDKNISKFLLKNLKSIKKLAKKEGFDLIKLIKKLNSDE